MVPARAEMALAEAQRQAALGSALQVLADLTLSVRIAAAALSVTRLSPSRSRLPFWKESPNMADIRTPSGDTRVALWSGLPD